MQHNQGWPAPAKLNLFLYITGRRTDGYHQLQTLFQFIDYCDYLYFIPRIDNKINLVTEFDGVAQHDNLIIKAAMLLLNYAQTHHLILPENYGVDITIDKVLPMGGGLGGGSSNAATTLVALNQIWQLAISIEQLMILGRQLGADVPIFIYGHSAFAEGIGDQLQAVAPIEHWYLVIKPDIAIATAAIFNHAELKRDSITRELTTLLATPYTNDCEPIVRKLYPVIDSLINQLSPKTPTRLTGTGSCIFCECSGEQHAKQLQQSLPRHIASTQLTSFIAKGRNQSPLMDKKV